MKRMLVLLIGFTLTLSGLTACGESKKTSSSIKETNYGSIEDFSYKLSGDKVLLNRYKGDAKVLEIKNTYKIENKKYKTDISNFQVNSKHVETLIIDEGFTEVYTAIFNSCSVKHIYFPNSMKNVYDYTLSYLHPDDGEMINIYYAGTNKKWKKIFTKYERTNVKDAKSSQKGIAIADKLNEMLGSNYDSSLFEYHFSANIDDIK